MAKTQRGQALLLIALAFVGLAAFIGLAVDAGILFVTNGQLRRAVDASAMAAAAQFRRDTTQAEFDATVRQTLRANNIDPDAASLLVRFCDLPGDPILSNDPALCPGGANNPSTFNRKLVRVNAELNAKLAFLPIIGVSTVTLKAEAISEAASVDIVLVIDTSESMAADSWGSFPSCNGNNSCYPFEYVRQASRAFVREMYYPYDRVSLVHFDAEGYPPIALTNVEGDLLTAIGETGGTTGLKLVEMPGCWSPVNPSGCLSTNTAGGLREAGNALAAPAPSGGRQEALWVVVLLSDGAANQAQDIRTDAELPVPWPNVMIDGSQIDFLCPNDYLIAGTPPPAVYEPTQPPPPTPAPAWFTPFCRDGRFGGYNSPERHMWNSPWYDVEDFTRDVADQLGCYQLTNPDASQHCRTYDAGITFGDGQVAGGYQALMFTIGMGPQVTNGSCDPYYDGSTDPKTCRPDLGEQLLRYIAAVGDDGDPSTDPCESTPVGNDCGNYYYRSSAANLEEVFRDIARRIYTKITH